MARFFGRGLAALALVALVLAPGAFAYDNVLEALLNQNDTTMAYMAYASSSLASDLSDPSLVATLFVARDSAYASGYSALLSSAGADASLAAEAAIAYSVVPGEAFAPSDLEAGLTLQTLLNGATVSIASTDSSSDAIDTLRLVSTSNQVVSIEGDAVKGGKSSIVFVSQLLVPSAASYGAGDSDALNAASLAPEVELGTASIVIASDWAAPAPELE